MSDANDKQFAKTFGCSDFEAHTLRLGDSMLYSAIVNLGPVHVGYIDRRWTLRSTGSTDRDTIIMFFRDRKERIANAEREKGQEEYRADRRNP